MEVLSRDGALSLGQLVDRSGFARQTVYNYLEHLVTAGIVSKEAARHSRGRPAILYRLSKRLVEGVELSDIVSLTFKKLRHVCRFEKGGWCKEIKSSCAAKNCPLIIK
ncbi:MAG: helix-turn-helix domain-containing protein [Nitrososphaerales archaeon]